MRPKKQLVSAILVLLCLSTVAVSTVLAGESELSIKFKAKAKGAGAVIWGLAGIPADYPPSLVYGEYDYHAVLTKSKFDLKGKLTEVTHDYRSADEEVWWFYDAKGKGKLHAKWGEHEFKIKIAMDGDSFGGYRIYYGYPHLIAGVNEYACEGCIAPSEGDILYDLFDPQWATMAFKGKYDGDEISGRLNTFLGDLGFFVNLWIDDLDLYLCFIWLTTELDIPVYGTNIVVTVPAVKKLKFKVKFKSK